MRSCDKVHRRDILERAWVRVRAGWGAPGIDRTTIADVEACGAQRLLEELSADVRGEQRAPLPARRVWIREARRLRAASALPSPPCATASCRRRRRSSSSRSLRPTFCPAPSAFGRSGRRAGALQALIDEAWQGRRWVARTDIASCFEAIPHERLMQAIEERVCDRKLLKLLRAMLGAGVMEDGVVRGAATGTPQGGVISPLLCNIYLHRLDRAWQAQRYGRLVRYADDLVVMCASRRQAQGALAALTALLAGIGLAPKAPAGPDRAPQGGWRGP